MGDFPRGRHPVCIVFLTTIIFSPANSVEHHHDDRARSKLIIGCGVAGKILAWTLAPQGQKTVVVERSLIGGSCVNVACLPSKNVIYSAKAVVQTAILGGMPYTALRGAIFTHPTMAEG